VSRGEALRPRTGQEAGDSADAAVPLTVLTGFLGAGKTTLVNRVLRGEAGVPVGVLVNDFGAIDIDRELIAGESEGVMSLANGCICCSLREDLVASVTRLLARPDAPRRVLLEASGVADPGPIANTFMAPAFRHRLRLDGVVCVVDAEQAFLTPEVEGLQWRQIGHADLVVLNKADLAGPERTAEVAARIRGEFSGARIIETVRGNLPAEVLFSPSEPSSKSVRRRERGPSGEFAADRFAAWSFESGETFCADALHELPRRLPHWIYRGKGIVRLAGRNGPDHRGVLQIVGRRADLVLERAWRAGDRSRLVFIGAAGAMQASRLEALVRACLRATAHASTH
jgi:G3E family GTPase